MSDPTGLPLSGRYATPWVTCGRVEWRCMRAWEGGWSWHVMRHDGIAAGGWAPTLEEAKRAAANEARRHA